MAKSIKNALLISSREKLTIRQENSYFQQLKIENHIFKNKKKCKKGVVPVQAKVSAHL